ncbi:MAG: FAD:protein FMN transferase [Marmoricola sp.]|nr:FAD:protein FMN transferase [Marmoricola sp.]
MSVAPLADPPTDSLSATWRDWSCTIRVGVQSADRSALERADAVVRDLMAEVAAAVDRFRPDSDLSRVNARPGHLVAVSPLTTTLVGLALRAAERTDGACDPTVGTALRRAGYVDDIDAVRRFRQATTAAQPAAGWRSVELDRARHRVAVTPDGLLDLGATAKAWTADQASARASDELGLPVLVSIGGDLAVSGSDRPWRLDVSEHEGGAGQRVKITHGGLATSSTGGRRWSTTAGPRHHLIDPRTGLPAEGPWRTCSVWAPTACAANEASTTALVLGGGAVDWLRAQDRAARLVGHDGVATYVAGWPRPEEGES